MSKKMWIHFLGFITLLASIAILCLVDYKIAIGVVLFKTANLLDDKARKL